MYFDCYSKSSPARPNFDFVENRDRPMFGKRKPGPPDVRQKKPETARNPKKQVFEHHYYQTSWRLLLLRVAFWEINCLTLPQKSGNTQNVNDELSNAQTKL